MLRVLPQHVAPPAYQAPLGVRPRVDRSTLVFPPQPDRTVGARGYLRGGNAAALIAAPTGVTLVSADRAGRRRVRRFTIPEVLVVEEHRLGNTCELQLVTTTTTLWVTGVETRQAWVFCRELRSLIRQMG
ncbi:MAG: hypothetical protein ACRD26_08910 [Vicinamibacterales bacterium]